MDKFKRLLKSALLQFLSFQLVAAPAFNESLFAQTGSQPTKITISRENGQLKLQVDGEDVPFDKECGPTEFVSDESAESATTPEGPTPAAGPEQTVEPGETAQPSATPEEASSSETPSGGGSPSETETPSGTTGPGQTETPQETTSSTPTDSLADPVTSFQDDINQLQNDVQTFLTSLGDGPPTQADAGQWIQLYQQIQTLQDSVYQFLIVASDPNGPCPEAVEYLRQRQEQENAKGGKAGEREREANWQSRFGDLLWDFSAKKAWAANNPWAPTMDDVRDIENRQQKLLERFREIRDGPEGATREGQEEMERLRKESAELQKQKNDILVQIGWCPEAGEMEALLAQLQNLFNQLNGAGGVGGGGGLPMGGGGLPAGGGGSSGAGTGSPGAGAGSGGAPTLMYFDGKTAKEWEFGKEIDVSKHGGGGVTTDPVAAESAKGVAALAQRMLDLVKGDGNPSVEEIQKLRADVGKQLEEVNGHLQAEQCNA